MKVVHFENLPFVDFALQRIEVIHQRPEWQFLDNRQSAPRPLNGFLLITEGECDYLWEGGTASLARGSLIYLPSGCHRRVSVRSHPFSFWRISFRLFDLADGEEFVFSRAPFLVKEQAGKGMYEICERLFRTTMTQTQSLASKAHLCEFFSQIQSLSERAHNSRIAPALAYLDLHYVENTEVAALAAMCYLGEAQFYRLFRNETGQTPIEYRNRLRIERAASLLADGECTVGEISSMLGFGSLYYFSRIFKKMTGRSPTAYQNKN